MSQDTERREQKRLRRLGWEPTTPLPRVCGGPVTPQAPAPNRGQDTERLYCCCGAAGSVCADPDGRLPLSHVDYIADCARQPEFQLLAREVQASRKLVADLRTIPMQDDGDPYDPYADAYNDALRGVAHMIDEAGL